MPRKEIEPTALFIDHRTGNSTDGTIGWDQIDKMAKENVEYHINDRNSLRHKLGTSAIYLRDILANYI